MTTPLPARGEGMILEPAERDVLAARALGFAGALTEPAARERYQALAAAAANGNVPDELVPALEVMLDLLLQKAPLNSEPILDSVYARTPRGQSLAAQTRDVNAALRELRGQRLESLRVSSAPARTILTLETERVRLTLAFEPSGPRVESVDAGA